MEAHWEGVALFGAMDAPDLPDLEELIRTLCSKLLIAHGSEWQAVLAELRAAWRECTIARRNIAAAEQFTGSGMS